MLLSEGDAVPVDHSLMFAQGLLVAGFRGGGRGVFVPGMFAGAPGNSIMN